MSRVLEVNSHLNLLGKHILKTVVIDPVEVFRKTIIVKRVL